MRCKSVPSAKVLFGFFNTLFFASGFLEVLCGFLLLSDTQRILLSRLLELPEESLPEPPFYYLALVLLVAGITICTTAALGCWATYMPGYIILTIYFLLVMVLVVCECGCAVAAAGWVRCGGPAGPRGGLAARGGPAAALQTHYAVPDREQYTAAVDLAQTQLECCGMTDARNYDMSAWQLQRLGPRGLSVPLSCCVQDSDSKSYLNPKPIDRDRCQDITPNRYRHKPGCLEKIEDWLHQQYLILMLALFIFAVFKLGILLCTVFSCIQLRRSRRNLHSLMLKSMDNKMNENIYESKHSTYDEPLKAKYIQPNNFYSPRVRNPRLFDTKPNEMV